MKKKNSKKNNKQNPHGKRMSTPNIYQPLIPIINDIHANDTKSRLNLCKLTSNIHGIIFRFLDVPDIVRCSQVCRSLRFSAEQEHVWFKHIGLECRELPEGSRPMLYHLHQRAILSNFFKPKFIVYQLHGHGAAINSIDINGDTVLTSSKDYTANIWNIKKMKPVGIVKIKKYSKEGIKQPCYNIIKKKKGIQLPHGAPVTKGRLYKTKAFTTVKP